MQGMNEFEHLRHRPPSPLERPRELLLACAPLRSNVNLSRICRAAGCAGVRKIVAAGQGRLLQKIARDGAEQVELEVHRTLSYALRDLQRDGYRIVALEQATNSRSLYDYAFARRSVLVVGNERQGLTDDVLAVVDDVVEIPVYGLPHAHNVATAAAIALYEYCRQFPAG